MNENLKLVPETDLILKQRCQEFDFDNPAFDQNNSQKAYIPL